MPWRPGTDGEAPSSFVNELYGDIQEDDLGAEPEQDDLSDNEQDIFDPQMIEYLDEEYIAEYDNNAAELIEQMNVELCEGSAGVVEEEVATPTSPIVIVVPAAQELSFTPPTRRADPDRSEQVEIEQDIFDPQVLYLKRLPARWDDDVRKTASRDYDRCDKIS